ncbi:hypothetical protein FHX44_116455 [Pseudonocardia hierapolitana]|uniref:VOC domain-containing protein n=1 Tax=Pseudonocardia hierapolitana TaxID=1128676 RepID=A0A561T071_9PSEU|nr:hypothetical protein [Pseudonocardia hierapolitana]TWF80512.1 hypothetical protein FHX44_116455 [Pseudonocardia hierapolitana]
MRPHLPTDVLVGMCWDRARTELETAGIEFFTDTQRDDSGSWFHFRGPDGNVYELISRTRSA